MSDAARLHREAEQALRRGDHAAVEDRCRRLLLLDPAHADAHFLLGVAGAAQGTVRSALPSLERAVQLDPGRAEYWAQLARVRSMVNRMPAALEAVERALALGPTQSLTLDTLGVVLSRATQHGRAAELFRRAAASAPRQAAFQFNLASSLKFLGAFDDAEAAYEAALAADPHSWKAHSALSQLRRQTPERNHLARLRGLLAGAHGAESQLHLHMALAKELEDLGEYAESFAHLVAGKSARRAALAYRPEQDAELFAAIGRCWGARAAGPARDPGGPVFVVGMPRTGTTLVERILSSHPQVQSVGESQNFALSVKRAAGTNSPRVLDVETVERAGACDFEALGRAYMASTAPGTRPRFVDKMPLNFLYAGLIASALPHARIICLRRDPLDTCLSNFRQLFAVDYSYYDYAWDLLDCGRYYLQFDKLMAHWRAVLPRALLELQYESLVDHQEAETRRLLAFCGLPWDDACLRFEDNAAPVSTASAVQVRAPMHRGAVQRWRRYEAQLQELAALLRDGGIAV